MQEVTSRVVFKKYKIQIDQGTSGVKASIFCGGNTFETLEFPSMFLRSEKQFLGLDDYCLKEPKKYAGLVGDPVQDHNPNPIGRDPKFFKSEEFRLSVFYTVSAILDKVHAPEMCDVSLVIAYPANYIEDSEDFVDELEGDTWVVQSGHTERQVIFSNVNAVQQGLAVVYDTGFRWAEDGKLTDGGFRRLLPMGKILIGCFGSNSVEWSVSTGQLDKVEAHSVFFGFLDMVTEFSQSLRQLTGLDFSQAETLKVMREKIYVHKDKTYDMSYELLTLAERFLDQPKFQTDISSHLKSIGFLSDNRGSVILAGGVLLHGAKPIYDIFEDVGKRVEMAYDEKGTPDSPRLAVLRGLQKYHILKGGKAQ